MQLFQTTRLEGHSLSLDDYEKFALEVEPVWPGFSNPDQHLITGPNPLPHRIPRVRKNPAFAQIGLILGVSKQERAIVGSVGFHDFPDERGMIEVGYGIVEPLQNQGYGKELLHGAWRYIALRDDVKVLRYTVSPNNPKSVYIINSLGFELVGEQMDEEDGLELIYELDTKTYLSRFH